MEKVLEIVERVATDPVFMAAITVPATILLKLLFCYVVGCLRGEMTEAGRQLVNKLTGQANAWSYCDGDTHKSVPNDTRGIAYNNKVFVWLKGDRHWRKTVDLREDNGDKLVAEVSKAFTRADRRNVFRLAKSIYKERKAAYESAKRDQHAANIKASLEEKLHELQKALNA